MSRLPQTDAEFDALWSWRPLLLELIAAAAGDDGDAAPLPATCYVPPMFGGDHAQYLDMMYVVPTVQAWAKGTPFRDAVAATLVKFDELIRNRWLPAMDADRRALLCRLCEAYEAARPEEAA